MQQPSHPKLAIFNTTLGIPSEVWITRQALSFSCLDPELAGWSHHSDAADCPLSEHIVQGAFPSVKSLSARTLRKLGISSAYRLTQRQKAAIRETLAEISPHIVMAHFGWTGIVLAQALPPDLPFVLHVHGRDASALMTQKAYRNALARTLRRADALIAVGQHQIDRLRPLGLPNRVALIPCGAPLDLFGRAPTPVQNPASAEAPVRFISVGRMSEEKGMRQTLQAFEILLTREPHARLTLIGFGPLLGPLKAEVKARGMDEKVRLPGRMDPQDIAAELSKSNVYLQHSREHAGWVEGFGVTLTEAGAAGLPLIASASGGLIDQITEGQNGFLFPPDDIERQADLMHRLATDPTLRRQCGKQARTLAARYDSAKMTAQLEALLLDVLKARQP